MSFVLGGVALSAMVCPFLLALRRLPSDWPLVVYKHIITEAFSFHLQQNKQNGGSLMVEVVEKVLSSPSPSQCSFLKQIKPCLEYATCDSSQACLHLYLFEPINYHPIFKACNRLTNCRSL
jgi:hypothetical protein